MSDLCKDDDAPRRDFERQIYEQCDNEDATELKATNPPVPQVGSKDLLSCPFCGGDALLGEYDNQIYADCTECDCSMGVFESDEVATKAWNTRAT